MELAMDHILYAIQQGGLDLARPFVPFMDPTVLDSVGSQSTTTWIYESNEPMLRAMVIKGDDIWEMVGSDSKHYLPLLQAPPLAVSPFAYTGIDLQSNKPGVRILTHVSTSHNIEEMDRFYKHYFQRTKSDSISPQLPSEIGARHMNVFQFFQASRLEIFLVTPSHVNFLDQDGVLMNYPGEKGGAWLRTYYDFDDNYKIRKENLRQQIHFALFCFSLMNCKNTIIFKQDAPMEEQRRRIKKTGMPLVTYRTIKIDQTLAKGAGRCVDHKKKAEMRLHLCRGNFARYSEEKPLFRKYPGLFFRPQHLRGTREKGLVVKNYEIPPPALK